MLAILWLNRAMHGSPFDSGYGSMTSLFTWGHVAGNLRRYPVWLVETQTPFVVLALAAPWALKPEQRAPAVMLLLFAALTFICYLPYTVWGAWWFLRFILPAFPPLLILSAGVALATFSPQRGAARTSVFVIGLSALLLFQLHTAARRAVFELRDLEARFRIAGEYVGRRLPANAVVFAETESGSIRFYSGRQTLVWEKLDPAWLDRALEFLRSEGYRPYFLFENDEEPLFKDRFSAQSAFGPLDWPPMAEIDRHIRIYDPDDRARYRSGAHVVTDFFWNK